MSTAPIRRGEALLFLLLLVSYAWFFQVPTPGAEVRMVAVRALVEQHTLVLDAYTDPAAVVDRAFHDGQYYSDKAPGTTLVGVVPFALARAVGASLPLAIRLMVLFTCGLAVALLGVMVARWATGWCHQPVWGLLIGALAGLGTPLFAYATLFQGHGLGACFLFGSAWVCLSRPHPGRRRLILSGMLGGLAVLCELPAAVPLAIVGATVVWQLPDRRRIGWFVAGGIPAALVFGLINTLSFGSPFTLGYSTVAVDAFRDQMAGGFFGLGTPTWEALKGITVAPYRGLFVCSPVVLPALVGLVLALRHRGRRPVALMALAIFSWYLFFVSSYFQWDGGYALGPRHLLPAIPFCLLGLAELLRRPDALRLSVIGVLGGGSCLLMLAATSVFPELPSWHAPHGGPNPLRDFILPRFFEGVVAVGRQPGGWPATNLGLDLGLAGAASLAPLLGVWLVAAVAWLKSCASQGRRLLRQLEWDRRWGVVVLVLIGLALGLRLWDVSLMEFKEDERFLYQAASSVADDPRPVPGQMSSQGFRNSPLAIYLFAVPYAYSADPRAGAIFVAILAALSVGWLAGMGRTHFNPAVGLMGGMLYATSPWMLLYGRKIWMQCLLFPFLALSLWALMRWAHSQDRRAVIWLALALSICVQLHYLCLLLLPVVLVVALCWRPPLDGRGALPALLLAVLGLAPFLIHELQGDFAATRGLVEAIAGGGGSAMRPWGYFSHAVWLGHLMGAGGFTYVLGHSEPTFWAELPAGALLKVWGLVPGLLLALGAMLAGWAVVTRSSPIGTALLWILLPITLLTLVEAPAVPHYLIACMPAPFLILGWLLGGGGAPSRARQRIGLLIGLVLVVGLVAIWFGFLGHLQAHGGTSGDYGVTFSRQLQLQQMLPIQH